MQTRIAVLGMLACVVALGLTGCTGLPFEGPMDQGLDLQKAGEYEEAIAKYNEFLVMEKSETMAKLEPAAQFHTGVCYLNLGQIEEAEAAFERVIENYPESEQAVDAQIQLDRLAGE
jgi:TolA-binding protein